MRRKGRGAVPGVPFETETARARSRGLRVMFSAGAGGVARVIAAGAQFLMVPLCLAHLGGERFGIWAAITSLTMLLTFADLGLGNALMSASARAAGLNDHAAVRRLVSSTFVLLLAAAVVGFSVFLLARARIPWATLFGARDALATDARTAVTAFAAMFALIMPLVAVARAQYGLQVSHVANLWQGAGALMSLALVWLAIRHDAGLPTLVAALMGGPLIAAMANALTWLPRNRLTPRLSELRRGDIRDLGRTGLAFFVLQLGAALLYSSDHLIAGHVLGADAVGQYAVARTLFSVIPMGVNLLLQPLWPAYAEAQAQGDQAWIHRTVWRALGWSLFLSLSASLVLLAAAPWLLDVWLGARMEISTGLLTALAVWAVVEAAGNGIAMLANGLGRLRFQLALALLCAICFPIVKVFGAQAAGLPGMVTATIVLYLCIHVPAYGWLLHRLEPQR